METLFHGAFLRFRSSPVKTFAALIFFFVGFEHCKICKLLLWDAESFIFLYESDVRFQNMLKFIDLTRSFGTMFDTHNVEFYLFSTINDFLINEK